MSETETEYEDVPAGVDPHTGEVTEPEDEPEEDVPLEEPEPEPEPQDARDDKEIEAIYKKLDTRAANYIKSAAEIVGEESVPLQVCEMCQDGYPGLRWSEPQDELHMKLLSTVTESEQGAPLKTDATTLMCDACDGFGVVKLPTHVANKQMRTCLTCNGVGYLERNPQSGAPQRVEVQQTNGGVEEMAGLPLDDPRIVSLKAEGYTVMPPFLAHVEGP